MTVELLEAPGLWHARWLLQRGLALVYLLGFVAWLHQHRPLLGAEGLTPLARFVDRVPFARAPSLFHWRADDRTLAATGWVGVALSTAAVTGVTEDGPVWASMLVWALLWALYLGIVNSGRVWYAFGWESLLCEAGFLAIWLGPDDTAPPVLLLLLVRWLLFRVEFGAGLIKWRGDPCWRDLSCLEFHHETQPMPNPLSRLFHHLPRWAHRVEVGANHVTQLAVPFLLFLPQPLAGAGALVVIVTQSWLVASGNFAWLNALTLVLAFAALPGTWLDVVLPVGPPTELATPLGLHVLAVLVTVVVVVRSVPVVRNLLSRGQAMNASFDPLRLVNTYGAFGSVTRTRFELLVEGTTDVDADADADWRPYEFPGKPTDVHRRPPQVAPYHLRLDWLLWFAAMDTSARTTRHEWVLSLVAALLHGDAEVRRLLRHDPFDGAAPVAIRIRRARYRFSTPRERRATGQHWVAEDPQPWLPPVRRDDVVAWWG